MSVSPLTFSDIVASLIRSSDRLSAASHEARREGRFIAAKNLWQRAVNADARAESLDPDWKNSAWKE